MFRLTKLLCVMLMIALSACAPTIYTHPTKTSEDVERDKELSDVILAHVNGSGITASDFKYQYKELAPQMQQAVVMDPKVRADFLEDLIGIELVIQEAKRQGLDKDAEYKKKQEQFRKELERELERQKQLEARHDLFNSLLKKELGKKMAGLKPVTDKEVADYFDQNMEKINKAEGKKVAMKDVEQQLKIRILQEKRRQMYLEYAKGLKAKSKIMVEGELLDAIVSSLTKTPMPVEREMPASQEGTQ